MSATWVFLLHIAMLHKPKIIFFFLGPLCQSHVLDKWLKRPLLLALMSATREFCAYRKLFFPPVPLKRCCTSVVRHRDKSFVIHHKSFFPQSPLSVHVLDKSLKRFLLLALMFSTWEFCCTSQIAFFFPSPHVIQSLARLASPAPDFLSSGWLGGTQPTILKRLNAKYLTRLSRSSSATFETPWYVFGTSCPRTAVTRIGSNCTYPCNLSRHKRHWSDCPKSTLQVPRLIFHFKAPAWRCSCRRLMRLTLVAALWLNMS